jgi:signal peptidase I
MDRDEEGKGRRRSAWARIGIATLNLGAPGLGLLRLQQARRAITFYGLSVLVLAVLICCAALSPIPGFRVLMASIALGALVQLVLLVASIVASWRESRFENARPMPIWSRWYMIALACLVAGVIANLAVTIAHHFYKPFYIPSEAMEPTLLKNDRMVTTMRAPRSFVRGDVIVFANAGTIYAKRIAALPGDTIALRGGIVILNGRPVPQTLLRIERAPIDEFGPTARRLSEQFPGEPSPHQIYDLGHSPEDDYPETRVLPGHLFVLGDNRDDSADSRVPRSEMGVEQLPITDVRGLALYYTGDQATAPDSRSRPTRDRCGKVRDGGLRIRRGRP